MSMLFRPVTYLAIAAALAPPAYGSFLPTPNNTIPGKWRESIPRTWDYTLMRSEVWTPEATLTGYQNWALDQMMDGNGTINVCMRWNSNETVTETTRQQIETMYKKQYTNWFKWLAGWDNYPFNEFKFNVIGWAVRDRHLIQGSTDGFEVYTDFRDDEGWPTCNPGCYRHEHPDGDYSNCTEGYDQRFHQYFLINSAWGDFNMGAASGLGVDISLYGWKTIGSKLGDWSILIHEMGHTFGFPDYVTDGTKNHSLCDILWTPPNAPDDFVMMPGDGGAHVPQVTEFEGWMLRHWWSRFSRVRGWQNDNTTFPPLPTCQWEQPQ
ncbi:hypothetical protein EsH8_II_001217 [Colletotrichum jinshuiense]